MKNKNCFFFHRKKQFLFNGNILESQPPTYYFTLYSKYSCQKEDFGRESLICKFLRLQTFIFV
ncbi:hypothetical protein BH739_12345 [Enterococcus casseliflavus]|nr:hypothetical protein BH739_12345 [Enterococcus casseliflavus]